MGSNRSVRAPLLVALVLASWVFVSDIVLAEVVSSDADDVVVGIGWIFLVLSALTVIWRMSRTVDASRRAAQRAIEASDALRSMELMTEVALTDLDLDDLLDELLARIRHVLGADGAALFLCDDERRALIARAAIGVEELVRDGVTIPVGQGVTGRIASTAQPLVVHDLEEVYVYTPLLQERFRSLIGSPLFADGAVIGVVYVVSAEIGRFTEENLGLLELVAERASIAIERARLMDAERRSRLAADHARRHLSLLSQASEVLSRSLDEYKITLAELGDVVVPVFADWFTVDLSGEEGPVRRLVASHRSMGSGDAVRLHRAHGRANRFIQATMASGRSQLVIDAAAAAREHGDDEARQEFMREALELGLSSLMIVPIRVRGLSFGAMTFGTEPERRGFRPSDLVAAERLAERVTVAIERVLLYREVQESASASERLAGQLRRLMEASLTVNAPLSREEVMATVALQARRVIGAGRALVAVQTADEQELLVASPASGTTVANRAERAAIDGLRRNSGAGRTADASADALAVRLTGFDGGYGGAIVVSDKHERSEAQEGFGDDDEYLLISLAQMASVALRNSELYQSAHAREEHLQTLLEAAPMGIVEVDVACEVRRWNRAAEAIFDWNIPFDDDWRPPQLPQPLRGVFDELVATVTARDDAASVEAVAGDGRQIHISAAPLREPTGVVTGMLAVVDDVSERKHLEEQLRQSQRMEAIGRLAGGVAHDFNNLLTVIIGYSDLVLRTINDDRARADLQAVKEAGEKAARLTSQLLAISRHQVLQPVLVDPNEVVAEMNEVLGRLIGEDVILSTETDEEVGMVVVDRGHLEQVILNLAVNARDAMPGGGHLWLETRAIELRGPSAEFPGAEPGAYVAVTVRDDGAGMDPEILERCFDPFFSTKPRDKGTGLGLATVYGIIRQSGGHIAASSTPGAGTTMRLLLPQVSWPAKGTSPLAGPFLLAGSERVLLVEDEGPVRTLARTALQSHGYEVLEAANGIQAMELAAALEGGIDLLVSDVIMPDMGGPELARRLRALRPSLQVLFISGYPDSPGGSADLGADNAFLAKPFKPDDLVARVREVLDHSGAQAGTKP